MIDMHVHCYPDRIAPKALHSSNVYDGYYETDGTIAGQVAAAKKHGIRKVLSLNIAYTTDHQYSVNEFASLTDGRDGVIISLGSVHPYSQSAVDEVQRLYDMGIRGIKFQPVRQQFFMSDPCCWKVFKKIGDLGMLTVIHCGGSSKTPEFHVRSYAMRSCISAFGGAPVVCAHMGGMFYSEKEHREIASLPVFVDTAFSARHLDQDGFNRLLDLYGTDRVMFGTDMPWASYAVEMGYINRAPLTAAEREQIFDGNAARLLNSVGIRV